MASKEVAQTGPDAAEMSYEEIQQAHKDRLVRIETGHVFDKNSLIGVPFVIIRWKWNPGRKPEQFFASCEVVLSRPVDTDYGPMTRGILNDGSTGIAAQLHKLEEAGVTDLVEVPKGLRRSDYEGPEGPATTFYLS